MSECQIILLYTVLKKIVQIGGHHKNIQWPNSNTNSSIHILSYDNKVSEKKVDPTNRQ